MSNDEYINICKAAVVRSFNNTSEKTDRFKLTLSNVYIVWFCKTLQNFKALLSTDVHDGMYYEVTFNGDKSEIYVDEYKKWRNVHYNVKDGNLIES